MAQMIPREVGSETQSSAERRIFEAIRDETSDDWIGLHSLGLAIHPKKPWAEIDFVLIGPTGIYSLEVKGGRISRHDGIWRFIDRHGSATETHHGPFEQVGGANAALARYLFERRASLRAVPVGYGVVTPDVKFTINEPDVILDVVYDADDTQKHFAEYVAALTVYWRDRLGKSGTLTAADVHAVVDSLRRDFDLRPSLGARLGRVNKELIRLTNAQKTILDGLDFPRVLVRGPAGSGKTQLAFDYALEAAQAGQRVLLTCYSRRLADELGRAAKGTDNLRVAGLHQYLHDVITRAGRRDELPHEASMDDLFAVFYPRLALEALPDTEELGGYDVLIVDEAQDVITDVNLDVFDGLLDKGLANGEWKMFLDPIQNLFTAGGPAPMTRLRSLGPTIYNLPKNCRNTRQVSVATAILSSTPLDRLGEVEGPDVEQLWWNDEPHQIRQVSRLIGRFLSSGAKTSDIVLLGPRVLDRSGLSARLLGLPFSISDRRTQGAIEYSTIKGFKGLESDIVVVVDIDELGEDARSSLYVAATRARVLLGVSMKVTVRAQYDELAAGFANRLATLKAI